VRAKTYVVYIMANRSRTLYVGCTSALETRIAQHRTKRFPGFTARYRIHRLVHLEIAPTARSMIQRERQIKAWTRAKRIALIESTNPAWDDLAAYWVLPALGGPDVQTPRFARGDGGEGPQPPVAPVTSH